MREDNPPSGLRAATAAFALRQAGVGMFEFHPDTGLVLDESYLAVLGYEAEELPGPSEGIDWIKSRTHPDDLPGFMSDMKLMLTRTRAQANRIYRMMHRRKEYIWLHRVATWRDDRIIGTIQDVSALKLAEREAASRTAQLNAFFEHSPVPMFLKGPDRRFLLANSFQRRIFAHVAGETLDDLAGVHIADYNEAAAPEVEAGDLEVLRSGEPRVFEHKLPHPRGEGYKHLQAHLFPVDDPTIDGRCLGGVVVDTTELVSRQVELKNANAFLDSVIDALPLAVSIKDARTLEYVRVNDAVHALTGLDPAFFRGKLDEDFVDPASVEPFRAQDIVALSAKAPLEFPDQLIQTVAGPRWLNITKAPIRDPETGEPRFLVSIAQDVTEKKLNAERLKAHAEALARSNEDLNHFAFAASHDLRSPLRAIKGLGEWLQQDYAEALGEEGRDLLSLLRGRVDRMQVLLDALLAYNSIGGRYSDATSVDISAIAREAVKHYAEGNGVVLEVEDEVGSLETGEGELALVLDNLVENAIKHHDRPEVHLKVTAQARGEAVHFCVCDDGPGIPAHLVDEALRLFRTLKSRDEVEGCGCGLALVKKQVVLLGGEVWIESEGRGTQVRFTWPRAWESRPFAPDRSLPSADTPDG